MDALKKNINKILLFICIFLLAALLVYVLNNKEYQSSHKENLFEISEIKNCNKLNYEESMFIHPKNFGEFTIGIEFKSERRWRKSLLNSIVDSERLRKELNYWRNFSDPESRVRHDADIVVYFKNQPGFHRMLLFDRHSCYNSQLIFLINHHS